MILSLQKTFQFFPAAFKISNPQIIQGKFCFLIHRICSHMDGLAWSKNKSNAFFLQRKDLPQIFVIGDMTLFDRFYNARISAANREYRKCIP